MGGPSDSDDGGRLTNSRRDFLHLSGIGAMGLSGIGTVSGSAFASTGTGHVLDDVSTGVRPATDEEVVFEGFEDQNYTDTFENTSESNPSLNPSVTGSHAHSGNYALMLDSFPGTNTRNSVDSIQSFTGSNRYSAYVKPTEIAGGHGNIGMQLNVVGSDEYMLIQSSGWYGGILVRPHDENGDRISSRAEIFGEVLPVGEWSEFSVEVRSSELHLSVAGHTYTYDTQVDWTQRDVRLRLMVNGWGNGHAHSAVYDDIEVRGVQSAGDGICADSARFCDDWSDGDFTSSPRWVFYAPKGSMSFEVQTRNDVPRSGPDVLQIRSNATHGEIKWSDGQTGWDDPWTLSGLFYSENVALNKNFQQHSVLINEIDRLPRWSDIRIGLGFRTHQIEPKQFEIVGPAIDQVQESYDPGWQEDTWYHWEVTHDGNGNYEGKLWEDGEGKPSQPVARSTGSVLTGEYVAHINVKKSGSAPFGLDYAFFKWVEGTPEEDSGTGVDLDISNVRLVQTVENTRVEEETSSGPNIIHQEPDPALVAGRNTSIAFDITADDSGAISENVTVEVERVEEDPFRGVTNTVTDEFELSPAEIEQFTHASSGIEVISDLTRGVNPDLELPIFPLGSEEMQVQSVMVRFDGPDIESGSVTLSRGTDFDVRSPHTLRVGFAQIQDPGGGDNYGSLNGGRPSAYEDRVQNAVEYMEDVFPVDEVVAYRLDEPIFGSSNFDIDLNGEISISREARQGVSIEDAIISRFVLEGQLPVERHETVAGNGSISEQIGFDETVLIVPLDYFSFHGHPDWAGVHHGQREQSQLQLSSISSDFGAEEIVAHELTHHFTQYLYCAGNTAADCNSNQVVNEAEHPMAQRTPGGGSGDFEPWFSHARYPDSQPYNGSSNSGSTPIDAPGVLLTKFDLDGGEYDINTDVRSIMSYSDNSEWVDSRLFQRLIEDGFDPTPPEVENPGDENTRTRTISGTVTEDETGSLTVGELRQTEGRPMASDPDGNVELAVLDANGNRLEVFSTHDQWIAQPQGPQSTISGFISFVLPFPETAAKIHVERDGSTVTIDPLAGVLDQIPSRVAHESFVENPEQRLHALANKLDAVSTQIKQGAYTGAKMKLQNDVRPRLSEWLQEDVEVPPNFYSKSELISLFDDVIDRIEALDGTDSGGNGQGESNRNGRNGNRGPGN